MNIIKFLVNGSAPDPYIVTFTKENGKLNAFCTCPAGKNGQCCKHRRNILSGNTKLIESNNHEQVTIIQSWLLGSDLEKALIELEESESKFDYAKKRLSAARKNAAKVMRS